MFTDTQEVTEAESDCGPFGCQARKQKESSALALIRAFLHQYAQVQSFQDQGIIIMIAAGDVMHICMYLHIY